MVVNKGLTVILEFFGNVLKSRKGQRMAKVRLLKRYF